VEFAVLPSGNVPAREFFNGKHLTEKARAKFFDLKGSRQIRRPFSENGGLRKVGDQAIQEGNGNAIRIQARNK
jgi:hypothetical protein